MRIVKRKAVLAVSFAGLLLFLVAASLGGFFWTVHRKLDLRTVEHELRACSERAAARRAFDWPPYLEMLDLIRTDVALAKKALGSSQFSGDQIRGIVVWQAQGCRMDTWSATIDVGFDNRHWPFLIGAAPSLGASQLLLQTVFAQDFFQGGGFSSVLFRSALERRLHCCWRERLEQRLLTPEELDLCINILDRLETARPSLRDELDVEYLLRCKTVLEIRSTSNDPDHVFQTLVPGLRSLYSRSLLFAQVMNQLEELRVSEIELSSGPSTELWRRLSQPLEASPALNGFFPWMDKGILGFEVQSSLRRRLLRTALAVARYGAATGEFPSRLEDLVPCYLPSVPVCPMTGNPLSYTAGVVSADVEDQLAQWTLRRPEAPHTPQD
jgi:hypothetical protein